MVLLSGCDPFDATFAPLEPAQLYRVAGAAPAPTPSRPLSVMTWNIKFAGARIAFFWECEGERAWMHADEVVEGLTAIAEKIEQAQPDILLLQEVDVDSKRVAYIDQVQWLLERTHFDYAAYASQWRADYVPTDGLGRIDSGNAILSRWPIREAQRIALPLIGNQDPLTRYFYLRRNILKTRVRVGQHDLHVLNTHLAALSDDGTKKEQIDVFVDELAQLDASGAQLIAGGDLNTLPPGAPRRQRFPDRCPSQPAYAGDGYAGEENWLRPLYDTYTPAIALADYQAEPSLYRTFSARADVFWTRKIDYLFANTGILPASALVHQNADRGGMETLSRSDHAPLSVSLELQ